jgi:tetratricopeptide (TPR) repeat protein
MALQPRCSTHRPGIISWHALVIPALVLVGLVVPTSWNLTRSDALAEARRAYMRGDLTACLQFALDHLGRRPWSGEAALYAARCLSRLDYCDAAEPYYRRAGRLDLNDMHIRAYGLAHGNRREQAIAAYEDILRRDPENVIALRRLAAVQLSRSHTEELLKLADRLARIPRGAAIGATLRGVVAHNDKDYEQASAAFGRVLELDPELREMPLPHGLFWSQFAEDLLACGRFEETARHLTKALEAGPAARLSDLLGRAYFLQGKLDEAEHAFREAAVATPGDYAPYLDLGKLEIQRQRYAEALKYLDKALTLAPQQIDVLYGQARAYRLLGRAADADRLDETIKRLRAKPPAPARAANGSWPRYAL